MFRKIVCGAVLAVCAASSFAAINTVDAINHQVNIGGTESQSFTFNLASGGVLNSGAVLSGFGDFSSVKLDTFSFTQVKDITADEVEKWSYSGPLTLAAGNHTLNVVVDSGFSGAYAGTLKFSMATPLTGGSLTIAAAVPEPETYAMLLAGLGALGFVGRRRKAG